MKSNGFTLLETIICLGVWSIILLFTIPLSFSVIENQKEQQFLDTLQSDVLFLQNYSIDKQGQDIYIEFRREQYAIYTGLPNLPIFRDYPTGWEAPDRTYRKISFTNGQVTPAGQVLFRTRTKEVRIVFPLGKGRGYIRVDNK